jgi:hypothetical protein
MPANRLLADSGYAGEAVTLMAPRQVPALKTWGDVTVDLLKRLDIKVDFAAVDDSLSRIVRLGGQARGRHCGMRRIDSSVEGLGADPTSRDGRPGGLDASHH